MKNQSMHFQENQPFAGNALHVTKQRLAWYAKRFRVMSAAEIAFRLKQHSAMNLLRLRHSFHGPSLGFHNDSFTSFSFCQGSEPQLPSFPWDKQYEKDSNLKILNGHLEVFGRDWQWTPNTDAWNTAPGTTSTWPNVYFGRIPYRQGNPFGDIRLVWEPSRLQQLVALALIAKDSNDEMRHRAVSILESQLLSWITANPFLSGVHYISAMECALRIIALCHALDMARNWLTNQCQVWSAMLQLITSHAELINIRVSSYSSLGNHTIAEAAGLVYAGLLFHELDEAPIWLDRGLQLLQNEADHQVLPDGGGTEQGWWYLYFISDLYGLVYHLLSYKNHPVPNVIERAFRRSRSFLNTFSKQHHTIPAIGDGDNGYALSPYLRFPEDFQNIQQPSTNTFSDSGYSLIQGKTLLHDQLIFDHGSLGMAPSFGHGHADALAVNFMLGEAEIFIDTGTYTYNGDPGWRQYFRSTKGHNTVCVDSLDQAVQETSFQWSQPYSAQLVGRKDEENGSVYLLGKHNGYEARCGVTHWRAVVYQHPGYWLIWDLLEGNGIHSLELNWHFGMQPIVQDHTYLIDLKQRAISIVMSGGKETLYCGATDPIRGWRSRCYSSKEPISTLCLEYEGPLPHEFTTELWVKECFPSRPSYPTLLRQLREWIYEANTN